MYMHLSFNPLPPTNQTMEVIVYHSSIGQRQSQRSFDAKMIQIINLKREKKLDEKPSDYIEC